VNKLSLRDSKQGGLEEKLKLQEGTLDCPITDVKV
jgi:hypothetical protein